MVDSDKPDWDKPDWYWDKPTQQQIEFAKSIGITVDESTTRGDLSELIDKARSDGKTMKDQGGQTGNDTH